MYKHGRSNLKSKTVQQVVVESPKVYLDQVMIDGLMSNTIVSLESDVAAKESEIAAKTTEITTLTSDLTTAQSDLATAQTNYSNLLASSTSTTEQLVLAEAQVVSLQASLATAQSDLATAQSDLATLQSQLATLQSDLATAQASLTTAQSDLATAQSDLTAANATITDLQNQLANSGGGGGGTLDPYLSDLSNTSEWTFFPGQTSGASAQPEANFLDTYSYDAATKIHSFTCKTITVGDTAYAINNGAEFIGPKWYKPATYSDGSPVMIGDSFSFTVRMENVTKDANMANYLIALDLFEWPFMNDAFDQFKLNYQRSIGFCAVLAGGSTKGFGTHANNNSTVVNTSANAELIDAVGTVVTPGGAQNSSRPSWSIYWSGNYNVRNTTTNTVYHTASTYTGQLYLGLLISTNGAVATTGGTSTMKISYSIGKLK